MITVQNVTKSFGKVHALKGVSLHVPRGSIQALLGPNGAGKTTLVRMMATLSSPDTGSVTIDGLDTVRDAKALRSKIGLTGQYAAVDEDLSGLENLRMFGRLYHLTPATAKRRAVELLDQFELSEAANRPAKTYSGGMRRRLDLAASLIVKPPVLFLDEPTTGLDPTSRLGMWEIMRSLVAHGTTVLLTTQYLEEADQLADNIAVINHGSLIAQGTADELKHKSGGSVLEVTIKEADHLAETKVALHALLHQEVTVQPERLHLSVPAEGNANILIDVVRALDAKAVTILDIQLRRPTLDDVFLALTGTATDQN